jgi:small-conductance mechanosensitive channel
MNTFEKYLDISLNFAKTLPLAIIGFVAGWFVIRMIIFFLRRAIKLAKVPKDVQGLIITVTRFLLWIVLFVLVAQSLGLGGLAVAISGSAAVAAFFLSASIGPLLSSIFSGIMLASDHDIKVGMKITTNDGKTTGTIKGIDMRKVRIEDDKGRLHVVPNSLVEGTEWVILDRNSK